MRVLSKAELADTIQGIGADAYCPSIVEIALAQIDSLTPPQDVSTLECAQKHRWFRSAQGDSRFRWELKRTPYLAPVMAALDDAKVREVIMPKPGRSGGTAAFECYEFKLMRFGPMTDMLIYLGSDSEVDSYCDKGFRYLFEDHPEIAAKIGTGKSDNKLAAKKVMGRSVEVLPANKKTITGRQAGWIRGDEIDTYTPRLCASFLEQTRIRARQLGNYSKVGITSHPDKGWEMGVAQAWSQSSLGIFIMQCPDCGGHASPYPTKFWPTVDRFRLSYQEAGERASLYDALELAKRTAAMICPHCGTHIDDERRHAMVDAGAFMHRGQTLDVEAGIIGEPDDNPARGFWIHGLMVKQVTNAELARDLAGAKLHRASTGKNDKLREVLAKVFGEVFEGDGVDGELSAESLRRRARPAAVAAEPQPDDGRFMRGTFPQGPLFAVGAVDVGARKFDCSIRGFDLEGRSWWIDRWTIRQRRWPDGIERDLATRERIDDWSVLYEQILGRMLPMVGKPGYAMPVAAVAIDIKDGNVVWKGREFGRRALLSGYYWGKPTSPWSRVRLIMGSNSAKSPEIPVAGVNVAKDELGRPVAPVVQEFTLGVHKLKQLSVERLGITDGGPGQCYFAEGIESFYFDEYFGERLIEGEWKRNGPNESLDLFGYEEAVRLMLRPDRADNRWSESPPVWARPVELSKGGDLAVAGEEPEHSPAPMLPRPARGPRDILAGFHGLNRTEE